MKVKELIKALESLGPEMQDLEVAIPKFTFPDDKYVSPSIRVEEMVISGGHWTTRQIRPGATESRGLAVTLG